MNVHYTARQTDLTPEIKAYCEKRLEGLRRLLGSAREVDIILAAQKSRQMAEIHIKAKGTGLVVSEETPDMIGSLNQAFDSLEKKIKKEREKGREKKRRKGRERKAFLLPAEPAESGKRIIPSPFFSLKPMTVEEAVLQLDMKNREVFVFRREGPETWAVLFRRKDGNFGLVEPE